MNRRHFISTAAAASLTAVLPLHTATAHSLPAPEEKPLLKPRRLKKGSRVALICPAGFIEQKDLTEAEENMRKMGFIPVAGKNVLAKNGYLAGSDAARAEDVNSAFSNPDIDGIFCIRGGYGCARMLPLIDYNAVQAHPKVIIGYSDVTSLLYALYARTGLVCFHGPVATSTFNPYSVANFMAVCMEPSNSSLFLPAPFNETKEETKPYTIRSGSASGKLIGGNLSVAVSIAGSPYDIDATGKILFFEEVGEDPYRIDRMLTQYLLSGTLHKAAGIILGIFSKCDVTEKSEKTSFSLKEVLMDRLFSLGIPVAYGYSFGHIVDKLTLPFGIQATINTNDFSLRLDEPAVL